MLARVQIPEVQPPAILGAEQDFRNQAVLESIRCAPLARHQGVVTEMPPRIISEVLRAAVDLPLAAHVEGLVIHHEHAARALALAVAQRRNTEALGPATHGMRAGSDD